MFHSRLVFHTERVEIRIITKPQKQCRLIAEHGKTREARTTIFYFPLGSFVTSNAHLTYVLKATYYEVIEMRVFVLMVTEQAIFLVFLFTHGL